MEVLAVRSAAVGAAWGLAVGCVAGLVDGLVAQAGSLSGAGTPIVVGIGLDGGLGLLLGGVLGGLLGRPRRGLVMAAVVALATIGGGVVLSRRPPSRVDAPPPAGDPVKERLRARVGLPAAGDVLVVAVRGLGGLVAAERLPTWEALETRGVAWRNAYASGPGRDEALAGMLSLHLPPGRGADGLAEALGGVGRATAVVLVGDRAEDAPMVRGFDAVRPVAGPAPLGLPPGAAGLLLARLAGAPAEPTPDAMVEAAEAWLAARADGPPWGLVVELPEVDGVAADAALASLVAAAEGASRSGLSVLVVSLPGRTPPPPPALGRDALGIVAALRLPDDRYAGARVRPPMSLMDVAASVVLVGGASDVVYRSDARGLAPNDLEAHLRGAAVDAGGALAAAGQDPGRACLVAYPDAEASHAIAALPDGARALRAGGYVLVVDAAGRRLYDEIADPAWSRNLLEGEAETCGGVPAARRADVMGEALDAAWARSAAAVAAGG